MRRAGASAPNGMEWDDASKVYEYALKDVPSSALKIVTKKFVSGEYENMEYRYIPRPPELAAMCRMEARSIHEDLRRLNEKKETLSLLAPKPKASEDEKERIRKMHKDFMAHHAATKEGFIVQEPMTEEKAEYWRAIMELKDSPSDRPETEVFKRSIKVQIEGLT